MDDKVFDTFADSADRAPLSLVDGDACPPELTPAAAREEVKAEATLLAVAAATAAGSFAVVGLTTVVMLIAVPQHWVAALLFTALFVLAAIGAGVAVVWRKGALTIRRRGVRRVVGLDADGEPIPAGAGRRRRRAAGG